MIERIWKGKGLPNKCVIGQHELGGFGSPAFYIDGNAICTSHALEIANALDRRPTEIKLVEVLRNQRRREKQREDEYAVRRARGKRQPGFVYYIRIEGLIKIGYASNIATRMRAYPPNAELLAAHPGTLELEKSIHLDYRAFLRRGREWFDPHPTLMRHIEQVREKFGDVSNLAYEYKKRG